MISGVPEEAGLRLKTIMVDSNEDAFCVTFTYDLVHIGGVVDGSVMK